MCNYMCCLLFKAVNVCDPAPILCLLELQVKTVNEELGFSLLEVNVEGKILRDLSNLNKSMAFDVCRQVDTGINT